jgi:hypothetical protein
LQDGSHAEEVTQRACIVLPAGSGRALAELDGFDCGIGLLLVGVTPCFPVICLAVLLLDYLGGGGREARNRIDNISARQGRHCVDKDGMERRKGRAGSSMAQLNTLLKSLLKSRSLLAKE